MIMLDEAFPPQIESQLKLSDGLFYDLSGEGNVIANNGATLTADHRGRANKAFLIDATNEYINCGDVNLGNAYGETGTMTINIGFQYKSEARNRNLFGKYSGTTAEINGLLFSDGVLQLSLSESATGYITIRTNISTLANNSWHYLTYVYNNINETATKIRIYLDGILLNINSIMTGVYTQLTKTATILLIGNINTLTTMRYYNAGIEHFSIFDRVLSVSEISQLYNEWRK